MFIAKDFVFISLPHSKSTSTRRWLAKNFDTEQYGHPHETAVPEEHRHKFVFTIVRHPYERALALWKKIHRGPDRCASENFQEENGGYWPDCFEDFCHTLAEPGQPNWPSEHRQFESQTSLLDGVRLDMTFKFEHVPGVFSRLPFMPVGTTGFPYLNRTLREEMTRPELMDLRWKDVDSETVRELLDIWDARGKEIHGGAL